MKMIYQETIVTTVERKESHLISKTILLNRDLEMTATLIVNLYSFQIEDAFWETLKVNSLIKMPLKIGIHQCEELKGKIGHIEGKSILNKLLELMEGALLKPLFSQCINGLIQAETYVYQERGFSTEEEYNAYWDRMEQEGCRMYSHPHKEDLKWMDYVPPLIRSETLFNRIKTYRVYRKNEEMDHIQGHFSDSFHEISIEIDLFQASGEILGTNVEFCRAPGKACFENKIHSDKWISKNIYQINKKQIISWFGGREGCYHLAEMVLDIRRLMNRMMTGGYDD